MNSLKRTIGEYVSDTSPRVTIYVGPNRVSWTLSEDLLCDQVDFFKKAFQGPFIEGTSKTMELPEDDPKDFSKVVDWLFTQAVACKLCEKVDGTTVTEKEPGVTATFAATPAAPTTFENDKTGNDDKSKHKNDHESQWCTLYVLAEKLGMTDLADAALDQLKECWTTNKLTISTETTEFILEKLPASSALYTLIIKTALIDFFSPAADTSSTDIFEATVGQQLACTDADFCTTFMNAIRTHIASPSAACDIPHCIDHHKTPTVIFPVDGYIPGQYDLRRHRRAPCTRGSDCERRPERGGALGMALGRRTCNHPSHRVENGNGEGSTSAAEEQAEDETSYAAYSFMYADD